MTAAWATIGGLALATAAIRAGGPVALGGRELAPRLMAVVALLAPALLAALVVTQTIAGPRGGLTVDERLVGLAAAGAAISLGRSPLVAVVAAASVTALLRALA